MVWTITVTGTFGKDQFTSDRELLGDAINHAISELGFSENDEGGLTITVEQEV